MLCCPRGQPLNALSTVSKLVLGLQVLTRRDSALLGMSSSANPAMPALLKLCWMCVNPVGWEPVTPATLPTRPESASVIRWDCTLLQFTPSW